MCGITGFIDSSRDKSNEVLSSIAVRMSDALIHRGPDDSGAWVDEEAGIALGHRRLSILDLSQEGHQPMISACGRYVIAFNGEIYNYESIRADLDSSSKAPPWRGHSDTEVMLAAFSAWGPHESIKKFVGMFAFALWDRQERKLFLARDRIGEKPLYHGFIGKEFLFGSELKACKRHPHWRGEIDRDSVALLLRHNCIPAPHSIYKDIFKLMPGSMLSVSANNPRDTINVTSYWSARDHAITSKKATDNIGDPEATTSLDNLLCKTVKQQMVADVPLGAFLSGGIDSSTIVSIMQSLSAEPVKTFTIGFTESGYDEAKFASAIARHLGTDHTEMLLTPKETLDVIPKLPGLFDEPFSDSSQIPTFLVSKLARQHVTVSLSGDGGDELFGGYNRYFWGEKILRRTDWIPRSQRARIGALISKVPAEKLDRAYNAVSFLVPSRIRANNPGYKLHKTAKILDAGGLEEMYRGFTSHWQSPNSLVIGGKEHDTLLSNVNDWPDLKDFTSTMMYLDTMTYLPDDILVKVDRASMAVSLESRIPFLDKNVVEFALGLPLAMKIRNGRGKWLLRQVLDQYVPRELVERPKAGFGIPLDSWLRGPLKDWAGELLSADRLNRDGFFRTEPIREKWQEHLSGKKNWQYHLWDILMFQSWLDIEKMGTN